MQSAVGARLSRSAGDLLSPPLKLTSSEVPLGYEPKGVEALGSAVTGIVLPPE